MPQSITKKEGVKISVKAYFELLRIIKDFKYSIIIFQVLLALQVGTYYLLRYYLKDLIDVLIPAGRVWPMVLFALAWTAGFAFHGWVTVAAAFRRITLIRTMIFRIRLKLIQKINLLSISWFDAQGTGAVTTRLLRDIDRLNMFYEWFSHHLIIAVYGVIIVIPILLTIDVNLTIITMIYIPLIVLVQRLFQKKMVAGSFELRHAEAHLSDKIVEFISGVRQVRLFGNQKDHSNELITTIKQVRNSDVRYSRTSRVMGMTVQFFWDSLPVYLWVFFGIFAAYGADLKLGAAVAYIAMVGVFLNNVQSLFQGFEQIISAAPSVKAVMEMIKDSDEERQGGRIKNFKLSGAVDVDGICFSYRTRPKEKPLDGVSLSIRAGERVAFVGESGSGKSTLVNVMLGLYTPASGSIRYDGLDLADMDLKSLREQVAILSQDMFFFNTTLLENLRLADPKAGIARIRKACEEAQILDFIKTLPGGFDTIVGERGFQLSGGQRQRLGMARVLLRRPKIVILDEPSSALDTLTEKALMDNVYRRLKGCTLIIIAHRLSTIRTCKTIFVFKRGRVIESGTYDSLSKKSGLFKSMLKAT